MDFRRKIFYAADNELQFGPEGRFVSELLTLLFEASDALTSTDDAGFKLGLTDFRQSLKKWTCALSLPRGASGRHVSEANVNRFALLL